MGEPHRRFGMTRPIWLPVVAVIVVVTAVLAVLTGIAGLIAWVAWSLGGVFVGAMMMAFDKTTKHNGG